MVILKQDWMKHNILLDCRNPDIQSPRFIGVFLLTLGKIIKEMKNKSIAFWGREEFVDYFP